MVVLKHALRNALIPVVTVAGLQIGILLGGTVVVEEVFTLPGIGRLVLWSIYQRDYPLTQSHHPLHRGAVHGHQPGGRPALRLSGSADPVQPLNPTETFMRAAVLFEQGKPQRVEEVALEAPRQGEVLVRMAASGVCHSCLHAADGSWKGVPLPIVLGDEGAGVVEALGPGVTELAVGDHVILSWAPTCGRCHYCVIGRPNLCERRQPGKGVLPDGTTRMSLDGSPGLPLRPRRHLRLAHRGARVVRDPHRSRDAARPRGPHRLLGHDRASAR